MSEQTRIEEVDQIIEQVLGLGEQISVLAKAKVELETQLACHVGYIYQHPETTKCYRVERPKGKFVYYPEFAVEKMIDKDAKALGYDVQVQKRTSEPDKVLEQGVGVS